MACRVGITTDPESRKAYWESKCNCFKNWQILYSGLSKEKAKELENSIALVNGCDSHPGGADSENERDSWTVYSFDHCGCA